MRHGCEVDFAVVDRGSGKEEWFDGGRICLWVTNVPNRLTVDERCRDVKPKRRVATIDED
jgi:hypothetical protein